MCRQKGSKGFCSELGAEPELWRRQAPLPKPSWVEESLPIFIQSFELVMAGRVENAQYLVKQSPDERLRQWYDVHAQNSGTWRLKHFKVATPAKSLPLDPIAKFGIYEGPPFSRDDYRCRYCNSKVIPEKVFRRLQTLIGEDALPLKGTNRGRSGYYLMFCATLDHVFPHSLGGRTAESNLVTCCWSCNYGKAEYTLDQLGLVDPFSREPTGDKSWTGLSAFL